MRQYYLDITPVLYNDANEPTELGTTRYVINERDIGDIGPLRTKLHAIDCMTNPPSRYGKIVYRTSISDASKPQPTTIGIS